MKREYLLGLLTVLLWSTSATAFKLTLRHLDPIQMLLYAVLTSIIILGTILICQGKFKKVFRLRRREYFAFLGPGFLNPFIHYLMVFKAYSLLPAQIAQPINYTWAIMLSILSVPLLKQSLTKFDLIATLICYSGAVIVSTQGSRAGFKSINHLGLFLAVSCTVIWALYWIYSIRIQCDPVISLFLCFCFSLPFTVITCAFFSDIWILDSRGLLGAIWVGCFEFGITFVIWLTALKLSNNAGRIANLIFLAPFVSLAFIHFLLGETIFLSTFLGLALIISGLLVQKFGLDLILHKAKH